MSTYTTYLGSAVWPDGTIVKVPPIIVDRGWYYKPEEARTDRRLTWGRGWDSQQEAHEWHKEYVRKVLAKQQWRMPAQVTTRVGRPTHFELNVAYEHPVLGWVTIGSETYRSYISFSYHPLFDALAKRQVGKVWEKNATSKQIAYESDNTSEVFEAFIGDPFGWAYDRLDFDDPTHKQRLLRFLNPPDLTGLKFEANKTIDYERSETLVRTYATRDAMLKIHGEAERVILSKETRDALDYLSKALACWGIDMRVSASHYSGELQGFEIAIPAKEDVKGREENHTIFVGPEHIKVTCGYVRNEERYTEYQRRQALEFFNNLDEFVEVEFD